MVLQSVVFWVLLVFKVTVVFVNPGDEFHCEYGDRQNITECLLYFR